MRVRMRVCVCDDLVRFEERLVALTTDRRAQPFAGVQVDDGPAPIFIANV